MRVSGSPMKRLGRMLIPALAALFLLPGLLAENAPVEAQRVARSHRDDAQRASSRRRARARIADPRARHPSRRARQPSARRAERRSVRRPATAAWSASPDDAAASGSVSVGRPTRGRLLGGVALESDEHVRVKGSATGQNFGTEELVDLLRRAAARMAEVAPGSVLHVGDLSRQGGGRFRPHRSHRSGRDADVGLFLVSVDGSPVIPERFYDIRRDGSARQDPNLRLDETRTWRLLEFLVTDTRVPVQFVFLARHIEERLLAEGRRQGASEELLARVDAVVDADRAHTSHMHVRIYCPVDDLPRCDDEPPFHPWVERAAERETTARAQRSMRPPARVVARRRADSSATPRRLRSASTRHLGPEHRAVQR